MAICSLLGQVDLTSSVANLCATASDVNGDSCEVRIANRNSSSVTVQVAIVPLGTASPSVQHWISYGFTIDAGCDRVMNPVTIPNGAQIFVLPSGSGVSCTVTGVAL